MHLTLGELLKLWKKTAEENTALTERVVRTSDVTIIMSLIKFPNPYKMYISDLSYKKIDKITSFCNLFMERPGIAVI